MQHLLLTMNNVIMLLERYTFLNVFTIVCFYSWPKYSTLSIRATMVLALEWYPQILSCNSLYYVFRLFQGNTFKQGTTINSSKHLISNQCVSRNSLHSSFVFSLKRNSTLEITDERCHLGCFFVIYLHALIHYLDR